jgi:hypothetical protein
MVHRRANLLHHRLLAATSVCIAGWAGAARGQFDPRMLQPVEPGIGDLGPLTTSTRLLPFDLRQPSGFERVFRVPGSSRGLGTITPAGSDDQYARVSGAITAVFPRSEYFESGNGIRPAVPSGTVFYIGNSPLLGGVPAAIRGPSMYAASTSVSMLVSMAAIEPPGSDAGPVDRRMRMDQEPSLRESVQPVRSENLPAENIFVDERFRRARVRQLLDLGPE